MDPVYVCKITFYYYEKKLLFVPLMSTNKDGDRFLFPQHSADMFM